MFGKRLIALMSAFIMIFALALPCFAESEDYDATVTLLPENLTNRPEYVGLTVIDISGEVEIDVLYSSGLEKTYTAPSLRVYFYQGSSTCYGVLYGSVLSGSDAPNHLFYCTLISGAFNLSAKKSLSASGLTSNVSSLTISYDLADVSLFNAALCDEYGFVHPDALSQIDLENARQKGYDEGYSAGELVGTESGYQTGYDEGYDAGYVLGESAGKESGYNAGYDTGFREGEQSELSGNFIDLIGEIAAAPYNAIKLMFDFEILGINIAGLIYKVLTVFLSLLVLGLLFKYIF